MWKYVAIAIGILVAILIAGYIYYTRVSSRESVTNPSEYAQTSSKNPELLFFSADWCPHCKKAKPEWIQTKEYLDAHNIGSHKVYCVEYDCSKPSEEITELTKRYSVDGFPTVKLQYDNVIHDFTDTITKDNIIAFVTKIIG